MIAVLRIQSPSGPQQVRLEFAQAGDDVGLRKWKAPANHSRPDLARDSIELAKLAGKRWRYSLRRNEAATSMDDLWKKLAAQPNGEIGFIRIAKSVGEKTPSTLGIAWCRRTWCNHLVLDFLTVHPALHDPAGGDQGMGSAMFIGMAVVAENLQCPLVWGEATETSSTFDRNLPGGTPVLDHFFSGHQALAALCRPLPPPTKPAPQPKA